MATRNSIKRKSNVNINPQSNNDDEEVDTEQQDDISQKLGDLIDKVHFYLLINPCI